MIVTMEGKKLWVEGDKAYSVEDIASKFESLNKDKIELSNKIAKEQGIIDEHTCYRDDASKQLDQVLVELSGVEYIHDKIIHANDVVEVVDKVEEVNESVQEVPIIEEQEVKIEDAEEVPKVTPVEVPKPIASHRRFRI